MEGLDKLLRNPEKYRISDNYHASSIVFRVLYEGNTCIAKKPRLLSPVINAYYALQDKFFFGTRRLMRQGKALEREAEKMKTLDGTHSPKLIACRNSVLVRKYIFGFHFRSPAIPDEDRPGMLEKALEAMERIHAQGVAVGDAHVKNSFLRNDGVVCWFLSGAYDETNLTKAKAVDLLKFVYTTYTETRDEKLALRAAGLASDYSNNKVRAFARSLITPVSSARLWFPTRVPLDGRLNNEIKGILRG